MEQIVITGIVGLVVGLSGKIVWDWLRNSRNGNGNGRKIGYWTLRESDVRDIKSDLIRNRELFMEEIRRLEQDFKGVEKGVLTLVGTQAVKFEALKFVMEEIRDILREDRGRANF